MPQLGATLGMFQIAMANKNAFNHLIDALMVAYVDTFEVPSYQGAKRARRALENVFWSTEADTVRAGTTRQQWIKDMRELGRITYAAREEARAEHNPDAEACTAGDPSKCLIHGALFRIMATAAYAAPTKDGEEIAIVQFRQEATRARRLFTSSTYGRDDVPTPENGADGIQIATPGMFAEAIGFREFPDGSGGSVYRTH